MEKGKQKQKEISLKMRISSVDVVQYLQYDIGDVAFNPKDTVEYVTGFGLKVHKETEELEVRTTVQIRLPKIEVDFGEIIVVIKYRIQPFNEVVIETDDGKHKIPKPLLNHLTSLSANTLRGILHEKFKGTILDKEVFPLVDSPDLVEEERK